MNKHRWFVGAGLLALAMVRTGLAQVPSSTLPGLVSPADTVAQETLPDALPPNPNVGVGGGVLQALPSVQDLPSSLFAPPSAAASRPLIVDGPYFLPDHLLDDPALGRPGWFGGVELQVFKPKLLNQLHDTVRNPLQMARMTSSTVALNTAPLDWTASPRFFLGYRLPSGYGEMMVAYRQFATQGVEDIALGKGSGTLRSRLSFQMIDFDYNSKELSLWPHGDMRWTVGIRSLFLFYDSRLTQPLDQLGPGNRLYEASQSNTLGGAGPHAALEVSHRLGDSGLALLFRGDVAGIYDGSQLVYVTRSVGPDGRRLTGETRHFGAQGSPIINFQTGLTWRSSRLGATRVFLGYQYERFWALNRIPPMGNNPPSNGQFWDQGVVLQVSFHF
jgi:hypothetical protein